MQFAAFSISISSGDREAPSRAVRLADDTKKLEVNAVSKVIYGRGRPSRCPCTSVFCSARGKFCQLALLSGCGKSTLFNIIAGLQRPSGGGISILMAKDATGSIGRVGYMRPAERSSAAAAHLVVDNVILGMEIKGV